MFRVCSFLPLQPLILLTRALCSGVPESAFCDDDDVEALALLPVLLRRSCWDWVEVEGLSPLLPLPLPLAPPLLLCSISASTWFTWSLTESPPSLFAFSVNRLALDRHPLPAAEFTPPGILSRSYRAFLAIFRHLTASSLFASDISHTLSLSLARSLALLSLSLCAASLFSLFSLSSLSRARAALRFSSSSRDSLVWPLDSSSSPQ